MGADAFGLAFADAMAEMNPVERATRDEQRWVASFLDAFRAEADKRIDVEHIADPQGRRIVFRASVGRLVGSLAASVWIDAHTLYDYQARALGQQWARELTADLTGEVRHG